MKAILIWIKKLFAAIRKWHDDNARTPQICEQKADHRFRESEICDMNSDPSCVYCGKKYSEINKPIEQQIAPRVLVKAEPPQPMYRILEMVKKEGSDFRVQEWDKAFESYRYIGGNSSFETLEDARRFMKEVIDFREKNRVIEQRIHSID